MANSSLPFSIVYQKCTKCNLSSQGSQKFINIKPSQVYQQMKTTQKLKQQIFKEVQASGLFKEVQSKLKTEVLNLVQRQSNQNKKQIGFQYEHPLLNKLRKYPLTSLCMDLMQQFLESFKFKYTLSVFKKEINRDININRMGLANNFNIQMKNADSQAVLLSLVSQLLSGNIKINQNKPTNGFATYNQPSNNLRVNNFIGNQAGKQNEQTAASNFTKNNSNNIQDSSSNSFINNSKGSQSQNNSSNNVSGSQQSSSKLSSNQSKDSILKPSSSVLDSSLKPSEQSISEVNQPTQSVVQPAKQDKNKKGAKKKKQVEKPPEGATDLMGDLMSKFKTKDTKTEEEKKNQIFEQKRAFSQQKVKKVVDPSESGTNKIRGVSAGKVSSFLTKFGAGPVFPVAKNESYIEQDMDQFQQSKDSTRKNPLYSSSQSGFDKSGYYDLSVDSNAIDGYEYVERAKKFAKKP